MGQSQVIQCSEDQSNCGSIIFRMADNRPINNRKKIDLLTFTPFNGSIK